MAKNNSGKEKLGSGKSKENLLLIIIGVGLAIGLVFLGKWVLGLVPKTERPAVASVHQEELVPPFEKGLKSHGSFETDGRNPRTGRAETKSYIYYKRTKKETWDCEVK